MTKQVRTKGRQCNLLENHSEFLTKLRFYVLSHHLTSLLLQSYSMLSSITPHVISPSSFSLFPTHSSIHFRHSNEQQVPKKQTRLDFCYAGWVRVFQFSAGYSHSLHSMQHRHILQSTALSVGHRPKHFPISEVRVTCCYYLFSCHY